MYTASVQNHVALSFFLGTALVQGATKSILVRYMELTLSRGPPHPLR
jgi:hypothetical protein